jgi:hypothetical protein
VGDLQARVRNALSLSAYRPGRSDAAGPDIPDMMYGEIERMIREAAPDDSIGCAVVAIERLGQMLAIDRARGAPVLSTLTRRLRRSIRGRDRLFLTKDAQFVLVFPGSAPHAVATVVDRLTADLEAIRAATALPLGSLLRGTVTARVDELVSARALVECARQAIERVPPPASSRRVEAVALGDEAPA